jgi:putative oxidoreductase
MSATPTVTTQRRMATTWNAVLWVLQIFVAVAFLYFGSLKLGGAPMPVRLFDRIGFGQWFRYFTGSLEIIGAVALLIPRFVLHGALLLTGVLVGALITHLLLGGSPQRALILLVLTAIIAWGRRDRLAVLLGR